MINKQNFIEILAFYNLKKAITYYGLEGALEAIDRVYPLNSNSNKLFKKIFSNYFE